MISTNIIENGLDLPHVNTIIIYRSNMFSLSGIYQLKGRVGRSNKRGYAYSQDLITWVRAVEPIALKNGKFGSWAENMQAYPAAILVKKNKYLFYNGNGFGMAGFGVIKII